MKRKAIYPAYRSVLILILLLLTIGLDQWTKSVAREALRLHSYHLLGDTFRLQLAENPGAFLGLAGGTSESIRFWLLTVGVALFCVIALWVLLSQKTMKKGTTVALTLFVAGGASNLIDRLAKSRVTDFMNLGIGNFRTGIFNLADIAIVIAALFFLWGALTPHFNSRVQDASKE